MIMKCKIPGVCKLIEKLISVPRIVGTAMVNGIQLNNWRCLLALPFKPSEILFVLQFELFPDEMF